MHCKGNRSRIFFNWIILALAVSSVLQLFCLGGCSDQGKNLESERESLVIVSQSIESEFSKIRGEALNLASFIEKLYADRLRLTAGSDKSLYKLSPKGVLYKPVDDGGAAVFVSGHVPVDDELINIVAFTAGMDEELKRITSSRPAIVQAYYNDRHSYNRIYPYFDVLSQYEPGMDIPSFNFYYLADNDHNPEKKAVWVDEPYVDPAGRGWMVSAIAPVYVDGELEGVAGIDVTANSVARQFLADSDCLLLLDNESTVVSGDEKGLTLLEMPPLIDHQYAATVTADTYRREDYSLLSSPTKEIRQAAMLIFQKGVKEVDVELGGKKYTIIAEPVSEMNWTVIKLVP